MTVLLCPRDGQQLVELKTSPPALPEDPVTVGYWCEAGHKLDAGEVPVVSSDEG